MTAKVTSANDDDPTELEEFLDKIVGKYAEVSKREALSFSKVQAFF
jgi:hypothetical protein